MTPKSLIPSKADERHPSDVRIGAVVIGRNEGARLVACLQSLPPVIARVVYVDSGSTDGSVTVARAAGAEVVELDLTLPFTAARARNEGLQALMAGEGVDFVQFIDGDCVLQYGWIETSRDFLRAYPKAAVVCGRRRERFPEASVWNRLCDAEWDTPVGQTKACGGDALMRAQVICAVGGYKPNLIAGEEPELCLRLRAEGWQIWRIADEMTLHDAAMTRAKQWFRRSRRAGYAYAEGAALHGAPPECHWVAETRRALVWGVGLPVVSIIGMALSPWSALLLLAYPAQALRLMRRFGNERGFFLTLGKVPEAIGVLEYHYGRMFHRPVELIEYK
ncbi:glycosyltransferase family A protein [Tabrizicola sp.]|uniref:glycosyltransferase family 2 protein n=1 Tax=Tabrizicola sp. TaxID=2005166 RepID=UPI00286C4474|nr:glycosyltransferase family A protein [Tabrizicola sp.]